MRAGSIGGGVVPGADEQRLPKPERHVDQSDEGGDLHQWADDRGKRHIGVDAEDGDGDGMASSKLFPDAVKASVAHLG